MNIYEALDLAEALDPSNIYLKASELSTEITHEFQLLSDEAVVFYRLYVNKTYLKIPLNMPLVEGFDVSVYKKKMDRMSKLMKDKDKSTGFIQTVLSVYVRRYESDGHSDKILELTASSAVSSFRRILKEARAQSIDPRRLTLLIVKGDKTFDLSFRTRHTKLEIVPIIEDARKCNLNVLFHGGDPLSLDNAHLQLDKSLLNHIDKQFFDAEESLI